MNRLKTFAQVAGAVLGILAIAAVLGASAWQAASPPFPSHYTWQATTG